MDSIDLGTMTDLVREFKDKLKNCPTEEIIKNGKSFVVISQDVWTSVSELVYQIDKANDYID